MADSLVAELLDMAADTVTVEEYLGSDEYGEDQYSTTVTTYPARVLGRTRTVSDSDGQERVSNVQITILAAAVLSAKDRFTLPIRFSLVEGSSDISYRQPKAIAIDQQTDENGAHHVTVYFSNARLRSF